MGGRNDEKDELLKKMDAMQKELKALRKTQVEEKSQAQLEKDWEHYRKEKRKKNILTYLLTYSRASNLAFSLVSLLVIYLAFKGKL